MPGLGLETCATPPTLAKSGILRWGVTASRKIGGAVQRNRAKRRLRAVARASLPLLGRPQRDYVLIARTVTLTREFPALIEDLVQALAAVHAGIDRGAKEKSGDKAAR